MPPKTTTKRSKARQNATVRLSPPELTRFEFVRESSAEPSFDEGDIPVSFGISVSRFTANVLGIEFITEIVEVPGLTVKIAYRAVFELDMPKGKPQDVEAEMKVIAAYMAPSTLYPYMRETIATTANKAGLSSLTLPLINFQSLFNHEDVIIPEVPLE